MSGESGSVLRSLVVRLIGDTTGFNDAMKQAATDAKSHGSAISNALGGAMGAIGDVAKVAAGAAIAGVGALTTAAIGGVTAYNNWAKQLDDMGDVLGTSANDSAALAVAIQGVGGDTDGLTGQMAKLAKGLVDSNGKVGATGKILQTMGVSFQDANGKMLPTTAILEGVANKLAGMPDGLEKTALMTSLFGKSGKELSDTMNALANGGLEAARSKAEALGLTIGEKGVANSIEFGKGMESLKQTLQGAAVSIGSEIMPALTPLIKQFGEWAVSVMPAVREGIRVVFEWLKTNIGPIFETILSAIRSVVEWVRENWPQIRATIEAVFNAIKAFVEPIITAIANVIQTIFGGIALFIKEYGQAIRETIEGAWNKIRGIVEGIVTIIQTIIKAIFGESKGDVDTTMQDISNIISTIWNAIKVVIDTVLGVISGIIKTVMAILKGDWQGAWDGIKGTVETIWNGIKGIVETVWGAIGGVITTIGTTISTAWDGFWNGLSNVVQGIWKGIREAWDGFWGGLKSDIQAALNWLNGDAIAKVKAEIARQVASGQLSAADADAIYAKNGWGTRALGGPVNEGLYYLHDNEFVLSAAMRSGRQAIPAGAVNANVSGLGGGSTTNYYLTAQYKTQNERTLSDEVRMLNLLHQVRA